MSRAALAVTDIGVDYGGVTAVDSVSFSIAPSTLTGLIGANGAGKTTLIDAITGYVPCRGKVRVFDRPVHKLPPHARHGAGVSRTFQTLELFDDLTVRENVVVAAGGQRWWNIARDLIRPRFPAESRDYAEHLLDGLGLAAVADLRPPELSLGAQKMATIARACANRPAVLLLDEPAAGLDTGEAEELGERLLELRDLTGAAILLVDHHVEMVLTVCETVHVMEFGKLIATGAPEEIRNDKLVIASYLGAGDQAADESPRRQW